MPAGPALASGEEQVRQIVMAQTCFVANAGVGPAIPQTIEIRLSRVCRQRRPGRAERASPNSLSGSAAYVLITR
jgi:hypothetical protein